MKHFPCINHAHVYIPSLDDVVAVVAARADVGDDDCPLVVTTEPVVDGLGIEIDRFCCSLVVDTPEVEDEVSCSVVLVGLPVLCVVMVVCSLVVGTGLLTEVVVRSLVVVSIWTVVCSLLDDSQ